MSYQLFSQSTCNGIWGKPLVNISFGAGANPGPPLAAAGSVYSYTASDCPDDGSYTVRNSSVGCFYNDWHTVTKDHTGDSSGYFLLINTSFLPNNFYLDTVRQLCSSTTYQFAAWILNMLTPTSCGTGGVKPNINFQVEKTDGTILYSFNTNDIEPTASPTWKQYAFTFSTAETSIVLRMTNINPGGCGGDFAIDDITLRPCVADVNINLHNADDLPQSIVYHCKSTDTSFTFNSHFNNIYTDVGYLWQSSIDSGKSWINIAGANTTSYTQPFPASKEDALYLYRLNVGENNNLSFPQCLVQANVDSVLNVPEPVPAFLSNTPVCAGSNLLINASGGGQYQWSGPAGYVATGPTVSVAKVQSNNGGYYVAKVISQYGCSSTDSTDVIVNISPKAFAGTDTSICEQNIVQLHGSGGIKYIWSPSAGLSATTIPDPFARPVDTTVYTLVVSNQFNCTDSALVRINVLHKPLANAGADKKILHGNSVQLDGTIAGSAVKYYWTPATFIDDALLLRATVNPMVNTVYTLHADSEYGCGNSTDNVLVTVAAQPDIPNVFSPNNDGINDTWIIKDLADYPSVEVTIFNRYGQKVFTSTGYSKPWNGQYNGHDLPIGTYYYIINLKTQDPLLQGSVTILK